MARTGDGSTRTDRLHAALRADILGGRLVPGERLKFPALSERYGTSVGTAREVLVRLTAEGLVKNQAHHGYVVTPLSHAELRDLTTARIEIESLVLGMSVTAGDVAWESRLVAAHHVLERTSYLDPDAERPADRWTVAHAEFHAALVGACSNRRLLDIARSLREEAELYRQWSVSLSGDRDRDVAAEHRALFDAALARDFEQAQQLVRDHLARTADLLISCAPDRPATVSRTS